MQCAHLSITNNLYDTRRELGLTVTSARLPPSVPRWTIRHYLRSSPVGLGTSTRLTQASDSLHSVVLDHGDQLSTDQKARFTPRRAHIRARFPTLLLSGCGHAAAVNEAAYRRRPSPALAALHPMRLPKRPLVVFQLRVLQAPNHSPCHHKLLLVAYGLAAPPAH